ncbi:putative leucine-rich repeat domain superfamily [Helianthus debilis subsp. tardiflorus]
MSYCERLKLLPSFIKMKSLQNLHLNSCTSLKRFPEVSEEMGRLLVLNINDCDGIKRLPWSIRFLTGLTVLSMRTSGGPGRDYLRILPGPFVQGCKCLSSLRMAVLKNNNLYKDHIPTDLHNLWPFLEELDLSTNVFTCLPASISLLSHLKYLNLNDCIRLEELPELPSLIQVLRADRCNSLQKIGDFSDKYKFLFKISLYCPKILLDQESQSHLANFFMKSLVEKCAAVNHRLSITVRGSKIPSWFSNQRLGNKITLKLPQNCITKMTGLALCCRFLPPLDKLTTSLKINFKVSDEENLIGRTAAHIATGADVVWVGYLSVDVLGNLCHDFESEDLIITFEDSVVECGVCVVYQDDIKPMTGSGSWIQDYDELRMIDHESESSENWVHGRWSKPTFYIHNKKIGDHKTVEVWSNV